MALPVTIDSGVNPGSFDQNTFSGPLKAPNQAIYVITERTSTGVSVYKATDPTDSFARQDDAGAPSTGEDYRSAWCYLSGSGIHIVTAGVTIIEIQYHVFDTASDTWTTTNEKVEDIKNAPLNANLSSSVAVRSDGDVIVLYTGDTDSDMGTAFERVDYARKEGSTWTAGVDVGGTSPAAEDRIGSILVRGSADNMHFFWTNEDVTNEFQARSLDSGNTRSTTRTSDEMTTPIAHTFAPGISWEDGATWRVAVPFHDADTDELKVSRWTETSGAIDAIVGTTLVGGPEDVKVLNAAPIACATVDGDGRMYLAWGGGGVAGVDQDLYFDAAPAPYTTWVGETEGIDATTINIISCNIYPRDGAIKLAFVYDEAGTVKYSEVSISAPTAPTMANSRFPDQNYGVPPFSI